MRRIHLLVTILCLAGAGLPVPVRAGLVLKSPEGDILIQQGRAAMPADGGRTVFDGGTGTYLITNPERRVYATGPISEYCEMFAALREAFATAMGSEGAPSAPEARYAVRPLGRGDPVSGYSVEGYRIMKNGTPFVDLWVATGKVIRSETDGLGDLLAEFWACAAGEEGARGAYARVLGEGVAVREIRYENGQPVSDESPVTAIEIRDVPDEAFAAPHGFRRVPLARVMGEEEEEANAGGPMPHPEELVAPPVPLSRAGRRLAGIQGQGQDERWRQIPRKEEVGLPVPPGCYFTMGTEASAGYERTIREAHLVTTEGMDAVDSWYGDALGSGWTREVSRVGEDTYVTYRRAENRLGVPPYVTLQPASPQALDLAVADLPDAKTRIVLGFWGGPDPEASPGAGEPGVRAPAQRDGSLPEPSRESPPAEAEQTSGSGGGPLERAGGVVAHDAKDVSEGVVDDTRNETKGAIRDSVKEGVKGFLKGLFKR